MPQRLWASWTLSARIRQSARFCDLLFYHLKLRCFIVVDLKMDEFKSERPTRRPVRQAQCVSVFIRSSLDDPSETSPAVGETPSLKFGCQAIH
ncbi:PDDEXK nuclease domain-containing protein [Cupriavidus sp. P-10]|uniref:PDDEXK nuclease domain-containing protein n=1 Tax=Cupriavidus sp. P-10 TaxID=2027911 RepID=UPI000E2E91F8